LRNKIIYSLIINLKIRNDFSIAPEMLFNYIELLEIFNLITSGLYEVKTGNILAFIMHNSNLHVDIALI